MKNIVSVALTAGFLALGGCSGATSMQGTLPQAESPASAGSVIEPAAGGITELFNLNYSNGAITVFSIKDGTAKQTAQFSPGGGHAQGLASDAKGHIYTTLTESSGKPCVACAEIFTDKGKLVRRLDAPNLGGSGAPSLTDIAVDASDDVYVSDFGQDAAYFFPHGKKTKSPTMVVADYKNVASILSTPNGDDVFVSGGCGFASVVPFTLTSSGKYTQGTCFGIGTIALIGGATDNQEDVMTPVDGAPGLVSISSPKGGGASIHVPDPLGSISGVAFNSDASIAYIANAHKEVVYAYARPAKGWLSAAKPKLLKTYKGFSNLDIIAIPQ